MPNYQNSKIYKLVNSVDGLIYVGSTITTLAKRFYKHKKDASKYPDRRVYAHLNDIGWSNVRIILLESASLNNKDELRAREQHYIDTLKPSLNKIRAIDDCPHGRRHNHCRECGGSSICEHNRVRNYCKDCGGASICEHNRVRNSCKDCGGAGICEHNRKRAQCKDCGGANICEHNKQRAKCRPCGGSQVCEHGRSLSYCIPCGGSQICEHDRSRSTCVPCGGSKVCSHDKLRLCCKTCSPVHCEACDLTTSKSYINRHRRTATHRRNVAAAIAREEAEYSSESG